MAKEKKGLGTGLDALFGGDAYEDEAGELLTLPISKVEPRSEQPREYFDEQALSELADSIAQYGVIQPIVARRLESGYYQIIAGERRWRAARMAGLEEVPVRVLEADDRRTAELALVENLLREDLNPIEEAKGYQSLINDYGLTQEEAARSVGRSRPAVTNSLRLLSLSPAVMELVEKKELSAGHARALIPITDSARQLDAAREVISKSLSVRRTEQLANRLLRQTSAKKGGEKDGLAVDYAAEISDELSRILGRRVHLNDGRKGGRIELEYYDADDREKLIDALRHLR
ncbi:MAG: ParB/RepB/Spo0J family partition protein [Oscillospiraceae bacterium]|jgi:ParB-like partition proteins|nr:ParB/RepB/Spo0J family partition protein [Oscillospiraceae bacterium]